MTRSRIQSIEDDGATGDVFLRDTASANGGAYAPAVMGRLLRAPQSKTTGTAAAYTPASNTKMVTAYVWGGGGGGGGASSAAVSAAVGAGGNAGGYAEKSYDVSLGQVLTYTVGALGAGGANTGGNGTAGGDSTVTDGTTLVTARGGAGGTGQTAGVTLAYVGASTGVLSTNGDVNGASVPGEGACRDSGTVGVSGAGANSFGVGVGGIGLIAAGAGNPGIGYGAGGGGACVLNGSSAAVGGAGVGGIIIFYDIG